MTKKNEAYACLRITAFAGPVAELTDRIGIPPTNAWHAGDPAPPPRPAHPFSAWQLRSRLPTTEEVERHVIDVLDQIRGRETVLRDLARYCSITMVCVGYFHEYYPGFTLDAATIYRLGECGAGIDLDFYPFFTEGQADEP